MTDATFIHQRRYAAMSDPDTWYVAFGPDKTVKTDDSAAGVIRSTRTFKSEVDAKLFAMQILAKGWTASGKGMDGERRYAQPASAEADDRRLPDRKLGRHRPAGPALK
jgi:hypothetical protein